MKREQAIKELQDEFKLSKKKAEEILEYCEGHLYMKPDPTVGSDYSGHPVVEYGWDGERY